MTDSLVCPLSLSHHEHILLAHGGGGRLMQNLIRDVFSKHFRSPLRSPEHDSVVLPHLNGRLAFTTDSYVIRPLFFPGGDIGRLSVFGTVNDLAMSGARPLYLSVGMILEEGLSLHSLEKIVKSMQDAADLCGVEIVTGDTKVVERGKGDGIFINTSGLGVIEHALDIEPRRILPGDVILLSGDLGRHGVAIMAAREGLEFETSIESDCAPLHRMVLDLLEAGIELHCLRDLTRGGLASALNEISSTAGVSLIVQENAIRVPSQVRAACEMLGLDPLYVANEGRFVAFLPEHDAERALEILRKHEDGETAERIGSVQAGCAGQVILDAKLGGLRVLDLLSGEQLPRIC